MTDSENGSDLFPRVTERSRPSRHEYEQTDADCPEGCRETDPMGRGMRRVTHYTGEVESIEIHGGIEVFETTRRYLECPVCGRRVDQ